MENVDSVSIAERLRAEARRRGWNPEATHPTEESSGIVCDGCYLLRQMSEFTLYGIWHLCVACSIDYEVGRAEQRFASPSQFLDQKLIPGELDEGDGFLSG